MAKKSKSRDHVRLQSTESHYTYHTSKSKKNTSHRLELRKYDPVVNRHVVFKETK